MKKALGTLLTILLFTLPAYAERVHIGDNLATDDLSDHIIGTTNQVTVTEVGDTAVLSTPQSIGTTSNVLFNSVEATAGVQFGLANLTTHSEGKAHWDDGDKTLVIDTEITDVQIRFGQQLVTRAKNDTVSSMPRGSVVIVTGSQGMRAKIGLADADTEALSEGVLGFTAHTIASGATGYVVISGLVNGVNTNAFTEGDKVYLSSVAGTFTNVPVVAPKHRIILGHVHKKHATEGIIEVSIHEGTELDEAHDVFINSVANNDMLTYNSTNTRWQNTNTPTVANIVATNLTASRLVSTNAGKGLASVSDLTSWIGGTTNRVTVSSDGDGSVTLTGPQDLATTSTPDFARLGIGNSASTRTLDIMSKTGTYAADVYINSHAANGLHLSIYNGAGDNKYTSTGEQSILYFDKPGATGNAFIRWFGPTYGTTASRGDMEIATSSTMGEIFMRPGQVTKWIFDKTGNLVGSALTTDISTGLVNGVLLSTGDCGSSNPAGKAQVCAEKMTTSAGVTKTLFKAKGEDGVEDTMSKMYGQLYIDNHSGVTITPTAYSFINVTSATAGGVVRGMTEDGTNGFIRVLNAGVYEVFASISTTGPVNAVMNGHIAVNGVITNYGISRKISSGGDVGSAAASAILNLNANDRVSWMINSSTSGGAFGVQHLSLQVKN